ncbi:acyltransferase [Nocardioides baekrokdamisoli]|uniref:Acyltransferase n=1 Tax=Nocardioides baekrokdamisoli TaxID=1804624 RepID=A0A3G9J156_9ACTN|nr:acyltransferase family protein [Nocardioides baekrokdamisoli]BBH17368.1 acyltransferase [Nocardioides baekrokdamisoli]
MTGASQRGFRTDVQALRALAVGAVVVYHCFPGALPGGFTGVDLFFVISGFLITSHLVASPPTTPRHLAAFWARRIRRLLPAALLVLITTVAAVQWLGEGSQIAPTARMARAASTYWINWLLAGDSVDYLHSSDAPTAVQHFWSLSVEEQFYAFWPVLLLVLVLLARAVRRGPKLTVTLGLGVVTAASLAASIHLTTTNPSAAYFVTETRIWELGVGALLGAWVTWHPTWTPPARTAVAAAGLAAIVVTFVTFDASTPFPGYSALLPVLGAAAVIAAQPSLTGMVPNRSRIARVLAVRPIQWLGDISYSIYLWHWPLLILWPSVFPHITGATSKALIIAATLVLAALTKRLVEDPAQFWRPHAALGWVYAAGVLGMGVVVGVTSMQIQHQQDQLDAFLAHRNDVVNHALQPGSCVGAAALGRTTCPASTFATLVEPPQVAMSDQPQTHKSINGVRDCPGNAQNNWSLLECTFGPAAAPRTVALVGDSHAQQWLAALMGVAAQDGFRITTHVASGCNFAPVRQLGGNAAWIDGCQRWQAGTLARVIQERPDLVVLSNRTFLAIEGVSRKQAGGTYTTAATVVLRRFAAAGIPVLVIRDAPTPEVSIPQCLDAHHGNLAACDGTRAWIRPDPWAAAVAATASPRVRLVDLNDHLCTATICPAVIGDMIVYYDDSHMTTTFNATLAPYLRPAIAALLR